MPTSVKEFNNIGWPVTANLDSIELFYTPGLPDYTPSAHGYSLFNTDYEIIQETFTLFWNSLGIFNNMSDVNNYTCLHIRRGDKLIYESSLKVNSIDDYILKIEENNLQESNILIVTDQYDTFIDFKKLRPEWNITTTASPENKGFNYVSMNKENKDNVKKEVNRLLDDLKYIINSKYFIGTISSNVSYIGRLIKNNNNSIILD